MNLADAPEQAALRVRIRTWLRANAKPRAAGDADLANDDEAVRRGRDWQARKHRAGWAGLTWPKTYGGQGRPLIDQVVWDQEAAAFDVSEEAFIVSNMLAGPLIIDTGTAAQKARHLPEILGGRAIWSQLFSEPGAGSDLAAVSTRAHLDGQEWVVNGQKVWSSGAHYADWGLLLARTDPAAAKHAGLSYFLLDMRTPGVTTRPIKQITGHEHFNEVFLDDVRIPADNLLGAPGDGWRLARMTLGYERSMLARRRRVEMESIVDLAGRSRVNGGPALADRALRDELAGLWMRAEALRFLSYRGLTEIARGEQPGPGTSAAKIASADLINRVGRLAVRLLGPDAVTAEEAATVHWQHAMLDATARRIAGGSDEIQRDIIAERVLGLPREPKPGKGGTA